MIVDLATASERTDKSSSFSSIAFESSLTFVRFYSVFYTKSFRGSEGFLKILRLRFIFPSKSTRCAPSHEKLLDLTHLHTLETYLNLLPSFFRLPSFL